MTWRKIEDTFYDDPKIISVAKSLKPKFNAHTAFCGAISKLWSWSLRHAPDGDLSKFAHEHIASVMGWKGEPYDLIYTLVQNRLLDQDGDKLVIHNWLERGGSFAESQRKQRYRQRQKNMSQDVPGRPGTVQDCPVLEEKRIEENRREENMKPSVAYERHGDLVKIVWNHYRAHHPKTAKELKSGRKEHRLLVARIEDFGGDVEPLKQAIDGYHQSPFHLGENPRQKTYLSLELIMRDVSHVQAGIEMAKGVSKKRTREIDDTLVLCDRGQQHNGEQQQCLITSKPR